MIDYGLLVSVMIGFGLPSALSWRWGIDQRVAPDGASFVDLALGPAAAAVVVGRLTTLVLDDPNSIGSLSDMLIIRSGVEFWPGVGAATALVLWGERRDGLTAMGRLVALAPLAISGYAGYEASCVFRDGCFGPASTVGFRPEGVATTMVPVGWLMAVALIVAAAGVRRLHAEGWSAAVVVAAATLAVATIRAIGSIWLPHVGEGLTRQHLTSIVAAIVAGVLGAALISRDPRTRRTRQHPANERLKLADQESD